MRYRFRVFLLLTGTLLIATVGWSLWRHASGAEAREAWVEVNRSLDIGRTRIDSLKGAIATLQTEVDDDKVRMARLGERIARYERSALRGRLGGSQRDAYERTIDRHNEIVAAHNRRVERLQEVYGEYSRLVDRHNAMVDSANRIQRRAVEEGIQLPRVGEDR